MAEMALEIQIERLRVNEITKARDAALHRLSDAYVSVRQKTQVIEQLQQEREAKGLAPFPIHPSPLEERTEIDCLKAHIVNLESTVEDLRFTVRRLQRQSSIGGQPLDPPPRYQENALKVSLCDCFRISKTLILMYGSTNCMVWLQPSLQEHERLSLDNFEDSRECPCGRTNTIWCQRAREIIDQ